MKIRNLIVLITIFSIITNNICFANANLQITAEKIDTNTTVNDLNARISKKFIPIKVDIYNKDQEVYYINNNIFYIINNKTYKTPNINTVYDKSKRHTARRAIIWGILGSGLLSILAVPASITHSMTNNNSLKDNIEKNSFRSRNFFNKDNSVKYVFIPKKHKNADFLLFKNITKSNNENFDIKIPIINDNLL